MKEFKLKNINSFPSIITTAILFINLLLINIPLLKTFNYEYSVANSILLFLASGLLTIWKNNTYNNASFLQVIKSIKNYLIVFCFIPFAIGLMSSLFFSICPVWNGLVFYFIITIPAAFFGIVTGKFICVIFEKFRYLIFLISFLFILFIPVAEFYFNPQLFFFNPIFGYFSGTIYDEEISVSFLLISYRLLNIIFFTLLAFVSDFLLTKKRITKNIFLFIVLVFTLIFVLIKPALHYSTTYSSLIKNLGKSLTTEHSLIFYSNKIKDEKQIKLMGMMHDYFYEQVKDELKLKSNRKIISFIFFDEEEKRKLFGSAKANVSKPWLNQIYIDFNSYTRALKHEMVHTLASEFGATLFKINKNFNPSVVEGLAMAIENNFDDYPVHYAAKIAYDSGIRVQLKKLFNGINFFSNYSTISYVYAGSFFRYLIDNYGIEKVKQFYKNSDFNTSFKKNIDDLENEYFRFLSKLNIKKNPDKAKLYFGGKTIFKKICPRSAAEETKRAMNYYKKGNFSQSEKLFSKIYNYAETYESLSGLINSLMKLNKNLEAEKFLSREIKKFKGSSYFYNLELTLSDVYLINHKIESAEKLLDSLIAQNPHIEYVNHALIRKMMIRNDVEKLKVFFRMKSIDKINYLMDLNQKDIHYFTVPYILELSKTDNAKLKSVVNYFKDKLKVNDFFSCYAGFKLSNAALVIGDYNTAKEFAVKTLSYKDDEFFYKTLVNNLKFINWVNNLE